MNNPKDINWINVTKALCLIGVFFVHCQLYYGCLFDSLDMFIYPFYVNGFFFVSGYLIFWKQLSAPKILEDRRLYVLTGGGKALFLNVLYRIIFPSIIFSIIEFVPSCLIQGRRIDVGYALYKTIGGGTYWFTSALVVAELILLLLFCTRKRNIWFYVVSSFVLGITGLVIVKSGILQGGVWCWKHGLISLIFLAMGGLYWKYEKKIDRLMRWWFVLPLFVVYLAIVIGLKEYNDPLISTLSIQPVGFVSSTIACMLLVWLCKRLPEWKPLTFIGQNSLGFYFLSGALPISLSMVAHKGFATLGLQLSPVQNVLLLVALWLLCLALAYLAVVVINRWLPWLWDLRKLSKK